MVARVDNSLALVPVRKTAVSDGIPRLEDLTSAGKGGSTPAVAAGPARPSGLVSVATPSWAVAACA